MESLPPGVDLSQVPLAKNPSGAPPNFVDPPSLLIAVQSVGLVLGITALMLVITRLIILHRLKRPFGLDDGAQLPLRKARSHFTNNNCSVRNSGMDFCGRIHRGFLCSYVRLFYHLILLLTNAPSQSAA